MANNSSDDEADRPSLRDRVRSVRETVQRKEQSIRAKRRAKARRERREEGGLVDEFGNLKDDVGQLASTAAGGDDSGGGVGETLSQVGQAFGEIDTSGLGEPMMDDESDDAAFVDPVAASAADDPGSVGDPDDELLDPAEADPLSLDGTNDDTNNDDRLLDPVEADPLAVDNNDDELL